MKSIAIIALAAALTIACAQTSQAGTITAYYSALGGSPFESVSLVYNSNPYTFDTAQYLAQRIDDAPAGPGVDTSISHDFAAYCVETDQPIYVGSYNTHADVLPLLGSSTQLSGAPGSGPVTFDATRTEMMERLWGAFQDSVVDQHTAAAFQLAVWEIAFDDDQTLVGPGSLLHVAAPDLGNPLSAAAIAENWLAQVRNTNLLLDARPLLLLTDASRQDLIAPGPWPSIPEPSSVVLAALALAGFAVVARRHRPFLPKR